jgi:hypothetical protein
VRIHDKAIKMILLSSRVARLKGDIERLQGIIESPSVQVSYSETPIEWLKEFASLLQYDLNAFAGKIQNQAEGISWETLNHIQQQHSQLMQETLGFLGGMVTREADIDGDQLLEVHQQFATSLAKGSTWSPSIIVGERPRHVRHEQYTTTKSVTERLEDSLVRIPLPRWDIWYLPLTSHDLGFWVAKWGQRQWLDEIVKEQSQAVLTLLDDPQPAEPAYTPLLPEIKKIWDGYQHSDDASEYRKQFQPIIQRYADHQKVHLWRIIADAYATYLIGPAYVHALFFLELNPFDPFSDPAVLNSSYMPSDARRAAVALRTLHNMDQHLKTGRFGPYDNEIRHLDSIWGNALELSKYLEAYKEEAALISPLADQIFRGLLRHFKPQVEETHTQWEASKEDVVPLLLEGADQPVLPAPEMLALVNAAWLCRSRYPHKIAQIRLDCELLIKGEYAPEGLNSEPLQPDFLTQYLLHSRIYDLQTDLDHFKELFRSKTLEKDRDAVSGHFFRIISKQEYALERQKISIQRGLGVDSALQTIIKQSWGEEMKLLREEILDLFGGVNLRKEELDQKICEQVEALLHDYARLTGVNWSSRVILGKNPLFSSISHLIHIGFPDLDIWNLPLMAHEFGHITAFGTPDILKLIEKEAAKMDQGHPGALEWSTDDKRRYRTRRLDHLHEIFADVFAIYVQGPAFAYNTFLLHLNPSQAYQPRGRYPTHGERAAVLLKIFQNMDAADKVGHFGPYDSDIKRLKGWWDSAVEKTGNQLDNIHRFERMATTLFAERVYIYLEQYFRLGARYPADDWKEAKEIAAILLENKPDLSGINRRNLLSIAWASRIFHRDTPNNFKDINNFVRTALIQSMQ